MELSQCLDVGGMVGAPPCRNEPEEDWVAARNAGTIPPELFEFYRATEYLSASAICGFETEEQRLVSTYFARVMRSLLDCLAEAAASISEMRDEINGMYTPIKKIRREKWDRTAARRYRATFRLFLIDLVGALDALAELVALVLPAAVPGLKVAKGSFGSLRSWAKKPHHIVPGIVTPVQYYAEKLHTVLSEHVAAAKPEDDWFELLRIYRNKVTHLGHQSWLQLGLQASDKEIYFFLPRTWPFIPERYFEAGKRTESNDNTRLKNHLSEALLHVDVLTYTRQVVAKVQVVVGGVVKILLAAYLQTRRVDAQSLAPQLDAATEHCAFTSFPSAG